jgi:hypothetical protein
MTWTLKLSESDLLKKDFVIIFEFV